MSEELPLIPGYEEFAALVHERFAVAAPAGAVVLELESAVQHGDSPSGRRRRFTLLFRGPRESPLEQATYTFTHRRCTTAIFIVPISLDAQGYRYEAIFNR